MREEEVRALRDEGTEDSALKQRRVVRKLGKYIVLHHSRVDPVTKNIHIKKIECRGQCNGARTLCVYAYRKPHTIPYSNYRGAGAPVGPASLAREHSKPAVAGTRSIAAASALDRGEAGDGGSSQARIP